MTELPIQEIEKIVAKRKEIVNLQVLPKIEKLIEMVQSCESYQYGVKFGFKDVSIHVSFYYQYGKVKIRYKRKVVFDYNQHKNTVRKFVSCDWVVMLPEVYDVAVKSINDTKEKDRQKELRKQFKKTGGNVHKCEIV